MNVDDFNYLCICGWSISFLCRLKGLFRRVGSDGWTVGPVFIQFRKICLIGRATNIIGLRLGRRFVSRCLRKRPGFSLVRCWKILRTGSPLPHIMRMLMSLLMKSSLFTLILKMIRQLQLQTMKTIRILQDYHNLFRWLQQLF